MYRKEFFNIVNYIHGRTMEFSREEIINGLEFIRKGLDGCESLGTNNDAEICHNCENNEACAVLDYKELNNL